MNAGSSITATYRVRDDVGLSLVAGTPFTFARLMQGGTQIQIPGVNPTLVSGDVKDGTYSVTFTVNLGLSGNYQIKIGAYDGTLKLTELTSPNINVVSG